MMNTDERHPLPAAMRGRVLEELQRIEREHQVTVLFACESGSRAWGFASPDSDYDVRFVYVHRPEWYLRVEEPRDVLERPLTDELDLCGWELRKALRLVRKSNPTLLEWLDSPLVYRQDAEAVAGLRELAVAFYSPAAVRAHYLAMMKKNYRGYLMGDEVRYKKYFYALRPLCAVRWIDQGLGRPPMVFETLLEAMLDDPAQRAEIDELLRLKRRSGEAQSGLPRPVLQVLLEAELERAQTGSAPRTAAGDVGRLDGFLRKWVGMASV